MFGPKRCEVKEDRRKLHNEELHNLHSWPDIIIVIKSRWMRLSGHVARTADKKDSILNFGGKKEKETTRKT
jgi:hypothetical protein